MHPEPPLHLQNNLAFWLTRELMSGEVTPCWGRAGPDQSVCELRKQT